LTQGRKPLSEGRKNSVAIIGAGVAGLTAALELANEGCEVTVFERAAGPGGKLRKVNVGGTLIDGGPTVFTMRWVFEELFDAIGENLGNCLTLRPLEILARHAWYEDATLDLYVDTHRSADAIAAFAGPHDAKAFLEFSERARKTYAALERPFMRSGRPSLPGLVIRSAMGGLSGLMDLSRISPFTSLWSALGQHFRDARLQQLFGRYATYCGSSPFAAPATLMLVAHAEQQGVWLIDGGMHRLATVMESLARARGVMFRYACDVNEIEVTLGRASGITITSEGHREKIVADAVISNSDANAIADGTLGQAVSSAVAPVPGNARSLSAVTWTLSAKAGGFPLLRHNVLFSRDYQGEFRDIFDGRRLPREPTIYICAQDRDPSGFSAQDTERFLVLVNAPASGDDSTGITTFGDEEIQQCEESMNRLMRRCGLTLNLRATPRAVTTPIDWNRLFPATGGALYGRASHGWMASFQRPESRTRLPGLYLAGGSVHPGPGLAMAALSGRLAAQAVLTDRRSIRSSSVMVTSGGTLTR
jgi:1-hydroxycarotenoid 3,4-desaturase